MFGLENKERKAAKLLTMTLLTIPLVIYLIISSISDIRIFSLKEKKKNKLSLLPQVLKYEFGWHSTLCTVQGKAEIRHKAPSPIISTPL
jgi:hypothetical protein